MNRFSDEKHRLIFLAVWYNGPWERLGIRLLGIDPKTNQIRREVKDGSIKDRLADYCDRRNVKWRRKYLDPGHNPHSRWERKPKSHV